MYENTTYKAFVAETAAKIAAEISAKFVTAQDTSLLAKDEATQHNIAVAASVWPTSWPRSSKTGGRRRATARL